MSLDLRRPEPPLAEVATAGAPANRLVSAVVEKMAEFEQSTVPGLELPRLYTGHAVLDDTTADLLYVLGLLIDCGVDEVGGCDPRTRISPLIASLDPTKVEAFASYRVGETVLRIGGLDALPGKQHDTVLDAVHSKEIIARLNDTDAIPPNFAVVASRCLGALGMAITIELAAIAAGRDIDAPQDRWLARADATLDDLLEWFPSGVIAAHQNRAPMFYRGPARRLQMTLDIYGKLLLSALELRRRPETAGAAATDALLPAEQFIRFDESQQATLWSYRSKSLSLALPAGFGFSADYAPSPRCPGLFEQPTSGHPVMLPVITPRGRDDMTGTSNGPLIPSGLPTSVEHSPGTVTIVHDGWAPAGGNEPVGAGSRTAVYRVEGRSLVVSEQLRLDDPDSLPGPLTLSVAEPADRWMWRSAPDSSRPSTPTASPGGAVSGASCPGYTKPNSSRRRPWASPGRSPPPAGGQHHPRTPLRPVAV